MSEKKTLAIIILYILHFYFQFLEHPEQNFGSICEKFGENVICMRIFGNFKIETEECLFHYFGEI